MLIGQAQRGIGLIEVLVALALLAIGVLGYVALQVRAVEASLEARMRSQAMVHMRALTEAMRANGVAQTNYTAAVQAFTDMASTPAQPTPTCTLGSTCTPAQQARQDAYQVARAAYGQGITLTMNDCPGVQSVPKRQCIFAAWGDTTLGTSGNYYTGTNRCMSDKEGGTYRVGSTCMMLEAY